MHWQFDCPNGRYEVKLCFIERQKDVNEKNLAIFNVLLNQVKVLNNYSIYNENELLPVAKSFITNAENQQIEIQFERIENNPKINGIEIKLLELAQPTQTVKINEGSELFIYPNPAKDKLYISNVKANYLCNAEIFTLNGTRLKSTLSHNNNTSILKFKEQSVGLHILRITRFDGSIQCKKIHIN
jgi:hypothetical protein